MTRRLLPLTALALLVACSGLPEPVAPAAGPPPDFAAAYAGAFQAEALDSAAAGPYLDLVDLAVTHPGEPGALPAGLAAVDALVTASIPGFDGLGPQAVAYRSREGFAMVTDRLRRAFAASGTASGSAPGSATLAILRGTIAAALHELALFTGDSAAAHAWGARRGCARAATVVGPLDWTPLRGLEDPSPIAPTGPLAGGYAGMPPFAAAIAPAVVQADACQLDVAATSALQGVRAVVVDLGGAPGRDGPPRDHHLVGRRRRRGRRASPAPRLRGGRQAGDAPRQRDVPRGGIGARGRARGAEGGRRAAGDRRLGRRRAADRHERAGAGHRGRAGAQPRRARRDRAAAGQPGARRRRPPRPRRGARRRAPAGARERRRRGGLAIARPRAPLRALPGGRRRSPRQQDGRARARRGRSGRSRRGPRRGRRGWATPA